MHHSAPANWSAIVAAAAALLGVAVGKVLDTWTNGKRLRAERLDTYRKEQMGAYAALHEAMLGKVGSVQRVSELSADCGRFARSFFPRLHLLEPADREQLLGLQQTATLLTGRIEVDKMNEVEEFDQALMQDTLAAYNELYTAVTEAHMRAIERYRTFAGAQSAAIKDK